MYRTNKIKYTYGWIKATAISRAITTISPKTDNWKINKFFKAPILNKTIIIWPAVKLAIKRIDKVRGRMIKLIDSISTINDIRIDGHPNGTKWLNISLYFIQPVIITLIHIGKPIDKENDRCLEVVKTKGKRPKILKIKINKKIGIKKQKRKLILIIFVSKFVKLISFNLKIFKLLLQK